MHIFLLILEIIGGIIGLFILYVIIGVALSSKTPGEARTDAQSQLRERATSCPHCGSTDIAHTEKGTGGEGRGGALGRIYIAAECRSCGREIDSESVSDGQMGLYASEDNR